MDLSLGFLFCSIDLYFCLCASTILSWWLWLCSRVWSQAGWFLQFHSSYSRLLWLFEIFLYFHTNCEIICSSSVKNTVGSLIGITLNLQIALGIIVIFTILILPIHEHGLFPIYLCPLWFLSSVFYSFLLKLSLLRALELWPSRFKCCIPFVCHDSSPGFWEEA